MRKIALILVLFFTINHTFSQQMLPGEWIMRGSDERMVLTQKDSSAHYTGYLISRYFVAYVSGEIDAVQGNFFF